jgi:hypothetical protein
LTVAGKVVQTTSGAVRTASTTTLRKALGADKYRRGVEDVVGRLSDALQRLDAALRAKDAEIARLRVELATLRREQS